MKKILIIINTMGRAGAEKSLISLLKSFDYNLASVSLLSIINRGEMFSAVPDEVNILNKDPDHSPVLGRSGTFYIAKQVIRCLSRRLYFFKFIPYAIKNILIQFKQNKRFQADKLLWFLLADTTPVLNHNYDLCIAFIEGAATYYAIDKVKTRKKCVFIHVNYEKAGYMPVFDRKYYAKADFICCISEAVKQNFIKVYPDFAEKTQLFPNIIHPEEIRTNAELGKGFTDDFTGIRLVTVGRLHAQKGYDIAIPAFAALIQKGYENLRWYIIGDGAEKNRLEKLITKHGLEGKFILLGSHENPLPYIKESDIYVQPSRFEGFPLTLQEALILNKPCLTTNFEGVLDILENEKNAVIIDLTVENLVTGLKKLIDDEKLRQFISENTKEITFDFPDGMPFFMDDKAHQV
ncbi:MAG: glycosyltransferase [Lachnospiraceae bacterium]|nr:glycosyltransferase [Lachnospiraceae bacterium]